MYFHALHCLVSTCRRNLTRHLYLFVILIIWMEFGGELGVRFSGHSKWKTIQHTKSGNDKKRSTHFSKLIKDILRAMDKGSTDPKTNLDLAKAITAAQKANVPAATIKRNLEKAELRKKNNKPNFFAFKGREGIYVLVAALTDNAQRTKQDLAGIVKRYNLTFVSSDLLSPFTTKGWIFTKPLENVTNVVEQGLEDAIEAGADEVEPDEDNPGNLKFTCESSELKKVRSELENRKYVIEDAYEMYVPRIPVEIAENEMHRMKSLLEEFEDLPEVEKVYTNIA